MFSFQSTSGSSRNEAAPRTEPSEAIPGDAARRDDQALEVRSGRACRTLYGAALVAAGLAACASAPPVATPEMTRAEVAIEQAQRAGAAQFAPEPLQSAQRKLSEAKIAVGQHENSHARQLVEESYADARLADFTAQDAKATTAAAEVDKSIRVLQDETTRVRTP